MRFSVGVVDIRAEGLKRNATLLDLFGAAHVCATKATGNGPVDAIFTAIRTLVPHRAKLELFQVHAVTEGIDAQAEVTVRLKTEEGVLINGNGADIDTLVAAAKAYLAALNKLLNYHEKIVPEKASL